MSVTKKVITTYICNQCDYEWIGRPKTRKDKGRLGRPVMCPKCKSGYWNDEKLELIKPTVKKVKIKWRGRGLFK